MSHVTSAFCELMNVHKYLCVHPDLGLNYLQKKNWHPGSLKNQEIVWIREQLQADIIKRE